MHVSTPCRRRSTRRSLTAALSLCLAVVLAACGDDSEGVAEDASGNKTLRVTVTPGSGSLPYQVAVKKGFFEDEGIKVKTTEGFDYTSYVAAIDRQFDVVMLVSSEMLADKAAGIDLQAYAGMQAITEDSITNPMITTADGPDDLEELAKDGGTLGLIAVSDIQKAVLQYTLEGTDADVDDLKLVQVGFPDMADQLKNGNIDAAVIADGFWEPLVADGYKTIFEMPKTPALKAGAQLPLSWAQFVSSSSFVDENPDAVAGFQTAIANAEDWIADNKEEALQIYADWIGVDYEVIKNATIPPYKAEITESDIEPWLPILSTGGLMDEDDPIDPKSMIADTSGGK